MNGVDKIFLSDKNVTKVASLVGKELNIKNTENSMKACKKFVYNNMQSIFNNYGNKKPKEMPLPDFLNALNKKTIQTSIQSFQERMSKRSGGNPVNRDVDLYGQRKVGYMKHPANTNKSLDRDNNGLPGMLDGGGGGYASFNQGDDGMYITATGEISRQPMQVGGGNNNGGGNDQMGMSKRSSAEELERMAMERQGLYDSRGIAMGGGGGMQGGMGQMGMGGMMNPMQGGMQGGMGQMPNMGMQGMGGFNYQPPMHQKPPEINFALDGGDTRNYGQNANNGGEQMMGGMDMSQMMGMMGGQQNNMGGNMFDGFGGMQGGNMSFSNFGEMPMQCGMQQMPNMPMQGGMPQMPNMGMQGGMMQQMPNMPMQGGMMNQMPNMGMRGGMMQQMPNMGMQGGTMKQQGGGGGGDDIMSRFNRLSNERGMGNFIKGGGEGTSILQSGIDAMKTDIAKSMNIDPKLLKNMNSHQIGKLIESTKQALKNNLQESKDNNTEINKDEKDKLLKMLIEGKKKQAELNKLYESNMKPKEIEAKMVREKTNKKVRIIEDIESDTEIDKSEIYEVEEGEDEPAKIFTMNIEASTYTEPEFYNDYLIDLDKPIEHITTIEISNLELPDLTPSIGQNTEFYFIVDDVERQIDLEEGKYEISELIESLNEALNDEDTNIMLSVKPNNHITMEHKEGKSFGIINGDNSIFRMFGFTEEKYTGKSKYISENKNKLIKPNKIYMFIDNLSNTDAFGTIFVGKTKKLSKEFPLPIRKMENLIVKFKYNNTEEDDLVNFNEEEHKFMLKIEHK